MPSYTNSPYSAVPYAVKAFLEAKRREGRLKAKYPALPTAKGKVRRSPFGEHAVNEGSGRRWLACCLLREILQEFYTGHYHELGDPMLIPSRWLGTCSPSVEYDDAERVAERLGDTAETVIAMPHLLFNVIHEEVVRGRKDDVAKKQ